MTACANPSCDNPLPARKSTGRPAIYCTPACRPAQRRPPSTDPDATGPGDGTADRDGITVELDHPATSPDGRPPERVWTVALRRGEHRVVIADALGWPTATALARQLDDLLAPPTAAID